MNHQFITLAEVIRKMDTIGEDGKPVIFDIKFVTADRKRGTAGEIIEVKEARKCIDVRNGIPVFDKRESHNQDTSVSRNPNHYQNSTRNILLKNGRIRKVHIRLIIEFNGQKVCF
jgi:hypothetical protein